MIELSTPLQYLKGVGPKRAQAFEKKGLRDIQDLLYFLPRAYQDRRSIQKIKDTRLGDKTVLQCEVVGSEVMTLRNRRKIFQVIFADESGTVLGQWFQFNLKYMKELFKRGDKFLLFGEIRQYGYQKQMVHPEVEALDQEPTQDSVNSERIVPVYSEIEGIHQRFIRQMIARAMAAAAPLLEDPLPPEIRDKYKLPTLRESLLRVHFPDSSENFEALLKNQSPYRGRLVFDEFFFLQLALALKRSHYKSEEGIAFSLSGQGVQKFLNGLPFALTPDQNSALQSILKDMAESRPMNRLLQGDVGSGKTVVSLCAALVAIDNGYQVALMAPTEILTKQHYETATKLLSAMGIAPLLLKGDLKKSERQVIISEIRQGAPLIIGTHALLSEDVTYQRLGLAIIDEQHRFGVLQRLELKKKGGNPDILVMTATPIPRTLSLTLYGDLDVSVIEQLPPGRIPIKTKVVREENRDKMYDFLTRKIGEGDQVYIVYPLVEESEKIDLKSATQMAEQLKDIFTPHRVALVHGQMKVEEKERVMTQFRGKEVHVLISTTVIEVGIDVADASIMVIEHAERFGLSQLHQLRGRVGRGRRASYCFLVPTPRLSREAMTRLKIMETETSGFKIAEADLKLRGPGEFMGTRQSGLPPFKIADLVLDSRILGIARDAAFDLIKEDSALEKTQHQKIRHYIQQHWTHKVDLAATA